MPGFAVLGIYPPLLHRATTLIKGNGGVSTASSSSNHGLGSDTKESSKPVPASASLGEQRQERVRAPSRRQWPKPVQNHAQSVESQAGEPVQEGVADRGDAGVGAVGASGRGLSNSPERPSPAGSCCGGGGGGGGGTPSHRDRPGAEGPKEGRTPRGGGGHAGRKPRGRSADRAASLTPLRRPGERGGGSGGGRREAAGLQPLGVQLSPDLERAILTGKAGTGEVAAAAAEGVRRGELSQRSTTALLRSLGSRARWWRKTVEVFEGVEAGGLQHNVFTYASYINALGRGMQWKLAKQAYRRMEAQGIAGNVVVYSALITACEKGGQWKEAIKVYYKMQRAGVRPNTFTFNALISACEKSGQTEVALEVFRWMTEQGVEPDTITYSALISACEKSGQWQKAVEIFGWMSMRRIEPNVYTYSALISACEKGGQWELAIEVFDEMRQAAVPPNATTYNALISACEKGGQWRMALEVAGWMDAAEPAVEKNVVTYSALISACEKGRRWESAVAVFDEMRARGVAPNSVTFGSLIEVAGNCGQMELAVEMYDLGMQSGCYQNYTTVEAPGKGAMSDTAKTSPFHSVDLHGLSETACRVCMLSWLRHMKRQQQIIATVASQLESDGGGTAYVSVITGWGKHSDGVSKVRIAVSKLLEDGLAMGIAFEVPEDNPGVFNIPSRVLLEWLEQFKTPEAIVLRQIPYSRV